MAQKPDAQPNPQPDRQKPTTPPKPTPDEVRPPTAPGNEPEPKPGFPVEPTDPPSETRA